MEVENTPYRYKSLVEREIERRKDTGEPLNMSFDELQELDDWYLSTDKWPEGVDCALGFPVVCIVTSRRIKKNCWA